MMKRCIGLVCGAVLLAALAAGCSGAFGFDGKDAGGPGNVAGGNGGGAGTGDDGKENPFEGTTWVNSENGFTLEFTSDNVCKITEGTAKAASIARAATAGQVNAGTYSYTWKLNADGSFTATLTIYNSTRGYATFTITASGAVSGKLVVVVDGKKYEYTFGKKTGSGTGSGTATEKPGSFNVSNGRLIAYTGTEAKITIPDTVKYINDGVFKGCNTLTSVTIPDGVIIIGNDVFSDCRNLTRVTMPAREGA